MEDDFLHQTPYKPIESLLDVIQKSTFVTVGVVRGFVQGKSWWYKSCNTHRTSLKRDDDYYMCLTCKNSSRTFTPRYSIHFKVLDESCLATFMIYDNESEKFLGVSAKELREKHLLDGGDKDHFPEQLSLYKDRKFLFKVSVKLENVNSIQPVSITIIKLCYDDSIINAFLQKYKLDEGFFHESQSVDTTFCPDLSDLNKDNSDLLAIAAVGSEIYKESESQEFETNGENREVPMITLSKDNSNSSLSQSKLNSNGIKIIDHFNSEPNEEWVPNHETSVDQESDVLDAKKGQVSPAEFNHSTTKKGGQGLTWHDQKIYDSVVIYDVVLCIWIIPMYGRQQVFLPYYVLGVFTCLS